MFIKYKILITKGAETDIFVCKETPESTYSASFEVCACGKYYPKPTIFNNSVIVIDLLVFGTVKVQEEVIITGGSANSDLINIADFIKSPNTLENSVIKHSLRSAIEHIKLEYGREYNNDDCPGQT